MQVKEAMKKDVIKVKRSTSLKNLLILFKDFHALPLIPVIAENEQLVGVVSLDNLVEILKSQESKLFKNIIFAEVDEDIFDLERVPSMGELILVDDMMSVNFISLKEDTPLEKAYSIMRLRNKDQLPVVDKANKFLGIIGIFDIIWNMVKEKGIV